MRVYINYNLLLKFIRFNVNPIKVGKENFAF